MTPTPATTPPEPVAGRSGAGNRVYTITVPLHQPLMSANGQRRAHWTVVRKAKAQTEMLVRSAANQVTPPIRLQRAHVSVVWHAPDARVRDADSLGPFLKAACDALVRCGVLPADDSTVVLSTKTSISIDRKHPRIEILLEATE